MVDTNYYETKYKELIYPLYVPLENNISYSDKILQHSYSISDRIDLTHLEIYSIDPPNCEDADDAFSIHEMNNKLYLYIHIADPTEYIELHSPLFNSIIEQNVTRYPSFQPPIHLMPDKLVDIASLMENKDGNIKKAITIEIEINKNTYEPENIIQLYFSIIKVKKENALSYRQASTLYNTNNTLNFCHKISTKMMEKRSIATIGTILNNINISYPVKENNQLYLYNDNQDEKNMKNMIAEFAIYTNSFIGNYLKTNLDGIGIFRTCNAQEWLQTIDRNISGRELLNGIIDNGITAEYLSEISSHDLVGMPEYCHFTSPMRRATDCICHYLIKYIYFKNNGNNIEIPFEASFLDHIANKSLIQHKKTKKTQYLDNKFRIIQVMAKMIHDNNNDNNNDKVIGQELENELEKELRNDQNNNKIKITFRITKYSGMFLNVIICKINEKNIHLSYCLRLKINNYVHEPNTEHELFINHVNCITTYDENTLPELDLYIKNKFTEIADYTNKFLVGTYKDTMDLFQKAVDSGIRSSFNPTPSNNDFSEYVIKEFHEHTIHRAVEYGYAGEYRYVFYLFRSKSKDSSKDGIIYYIWTHNNDVNVMQ